MQTQKIDEQIVNLIKKIEIPKNPLSFYLNIKQIEENLSSYLKNYFYKAINEFITPSSEDDLKKLGYSSILLKLYYYSGFTKEISLRLQDFLNELKFFDTATYLQCAVYFDNTLKLKVYALINNKKEILEDLKKLSRTEIIKKYPELKKISNIKEMENQIDNYISKLNEKELKKFFKEIEVDITRYPLSYNETKLLYKNYYEKYKFYYDAIIICFTNIVKHFDRQKPENYTFVTKILSKFKDAKKYYFIYNWIIIKNKEKAQKHFIKEYDNFFNSKEEFKKYLITYLINLKHPKLKQLFYWEAIKQRLNEDEWTKIWGANLFYLQKIDSQPEDFNTLLFFKQFKDTLIDLYSSIFWPFIKPYFYYILIFKAIKLPLKNWQKFFFLLMFFSAESYEEYAILQKIYLSIERIWIWNNTFFHNKFIFLIKRLWNLSIEFFSSAVLLSLLIFILRRAGLINIIMVGIILILMLINFLRYLFFPARFEIIRTISLVLLSVLWYIWFSTIFPKITNPQYISYIWQQIQALVDLNFSGAKESYNKMINLVYWDNYKTYEKNFITDILNSSKQVANNQQVKQVIKTSQKLVRKITDKYIPLEKWKYLKYYIDKEISKYPLTIKQANNISKKVVLDYINRYCSQHHDWYCKTRLEKLPVGFKINITKINEFIQKELEKN